ncbi:hypothetical protein CBOM_07611 [Ceraceosorus bombacis]|uniref:Uncharacterized protein n=1 Tax=Ceraceosorus bombacis TaxID=401625 RepID=A0A0P1BHI9_9BASI|nr:hypothetical protein CBOM_07611 [Ceraceosorus bombacis]
MKRRSALCEPTFPTWLVGFLNLRIKYIVPCSASVLELRMHITRARPNDRHTHQERLGSQAQLNIASCHPSPSFSPRVQAYAHNLSQGPSFMVIITSVFQGR